MAMRMIGHPLRSSPTGAVGGEWVIRGPGPADRLRLGVIRRGERVSERTGWPAQPSTNSYLQLLDIWRHARRPGAGCQRRSPHPQVSVKAANAHRSGRRRERAGNIFPFAIDLRPKLVGCRHKTGGKGHVVLSSAYRICLSCLSGLLCHGANVYCGHRFCLPGSKCPSRRFVQHSDTYHDHPLMAYCGAGDGCAGRLRPRHLAGNVA